MSTTNTKRPRDCESLFFNACRFGTLEEVVIMIEDGAAVSANALRHACHRRDYQVAESIVRILLERGVRNYTDVFQSVGIIEDAVVYSSGSILRMLIEAGFSINYHQADSSRGAVPPLYLLLRKNNGDFSEILSKTRVLIEYGADVNYKSEKNTVLMLASVCNSDDCIVQLLLDNGANVNTKTNTKNTALSFACRNRIGGLSISRVLIKAGAIVADRDIKIAFYYGNVDVLLLLAPYASSRELNNYWFRGNVPDPIGAIRAGTPFGAEADGVCLSLMIKNNEPANAIWALLRARPNVFSQGACTRELCTHHVIACIGDSDDPELWQLMAYEPGHSVHPVTRSTLLHVAARTGKHFAVDILMRAQVNPLARNALGMTPLDMATDAAIKAKLQEYITFRPSLVHMRWRGPYFRMRVHTFLCMVVRWRNEKVRTISKDVTTAILRRVAQIENV